MTIEAINGNSVGFKQVAKPNLKSSQNFTSKPEEVDEEKSNASKCMIGATALASIVGFGIAGRKGYLGKGIKKFLGGAEKAVEKETSKAGNETPKIKSEELNEEGRKTYLDIKQKLDGRITCNVKDKKSNELNELGQYYHAQEMKMNNVINNFKEQFIKENKLNYQIEFKKNKITVENGRVANLTNEKGESWQITEATDKEFVKELKQAINKENDKRVVNEFSTREGLNYLEAQEKSVQQKKVQSDKNNGEWVKKQRQLKEQEYSNWWNNALEQKVKETLFSKNLETINLRANGLKLNEEIVANGQKFVFRKGKLKKVLDANNKEVKMDKNVNLDEIASILSQKYEKKVVVPRLKKQIKNTTSIYTENLKNIDTIFKDLEPTITGENRITKKVADKEYTFYVDKYKDQAYWDRVDIVAENGQKLRITSDFSDADVIQVKDGKDSYEFLYEKGKYKLIAMDREANKCNIGDVSYYRIPHYKSNNNAEVYYKMPNYYKLGSNVSESNSCSFYTDLKTYYNQHYLGS